MFHNIKKNKDKGFHLTITDYRTGNVLIDKDTSCIIGSYDNDDTTALLSCIACNIPTILSTIEGATHAIKQIEEDPKFKDNPMFQLIKLLGGNNE